MSNTDNSLVPLFKSIGLTQAKAAEAAKSPKSANLLKDIIEQKSLVGTLDDKQAGLVAAFAVQLSKTEAVTDEGRTYIIDKIIEGKLKSVDQVTGVYLCD